MMSILLHTATLRSRYFKALVWYLESNASISANWLAVSADVWTVPLGGEPGKTFQIGKSKYFYSTAIQGFYNVAHLEFAGTWMVIAQFQIINKKDYLPRAIRIFL
jgi:hypothetical protein